MLRMTMQEYQSFLRKSGRSGCVTGVKFPTAPKAPKYRNSRVYVYEDGFISNEKTDEHGVLRERYDSIKEYRRGTELRLLARAGKISGLQRQVPLVIQPSFVDRDGKKHRAMLYKADYVYVESDTEIVEDVKGFDEQTQKFICTEAFNLKWKQLQFIYPEKIFRLY